MTLSVCLLFVSCFPITIFANSTDNEILTPELVVQTTDDAYLILPDEADYVLYESSEHIIYQIEDAVIIEGENGEDHFIAPVTVETEIVSIDEDGVVGETTITADLDAATRVIDEEEESFVKSFKDFFVPRVYANTKTNTTRGSANDRTLGVKITTTVHWKQYSNGNALVTKVVGGYTRSDTSISITSSSVFIGTSADFKKQTKTINLGTSSSWTKTNGKDYSFSSVPYATAASGSVGGAKYTVHLSRGRSRWSVTYNNVAWSKFNMLLN